MADHRPNLLLLIGEQHRGNCLSCAGHPVVRTPHIDRLAAEGTRFASSYCTTPLCVPSRAAMLIDRFAHASGIVDNIYEDMVRDQMTVPLALRAAGYRTCHVGKTHLAIGESLKPDRPRNRLDEVGFDDEFATSGKIGAPLADGHYGRYLERLGLRETLRVDYEARQQARKTSLGDSRPSALPVEHYHDEWVSRKANDYLADLPSDQPFYLAVNWAGPHAFRDAPGQYATMYDAGTIDPPIEDALGKAPEFLRKRQRETLAKLAPVDWRGLRASYYGMVSLIDDGIGRMLATLERRGMLDNTLVVFTADHGEMLCDHGFVYKTLMYEGSVCVPLIVRWPGKFAEGRVVDDAASLIDVPPTLLEAAGCEPWDNMQGRSMANLLRDGRPEPGRAVFSEFHDMRMIRHGRWKYVRDPSWEVQQLFDLENDPQELVNRVDDETQVASELDARIDAWLSATA